MARRYRLTRLLAGDGHVFSDFILARRFEITESGVLVFLDERGTQLSAYNNWVEVKQDD